ncbi:hypothetical protein L218DRAFT_354254 [Marasmius fiardii PR-910]|nr:hypothetical protein L218DRAFT_354254 [Marasmius fiardii PR-910]
MKMPLFDVLLQALKTYSDVPNGSPSVNAAEVGNLQSAPQTPMANLTAQDLNPSIPEITMQMSSLRLKDQVGIPGGFSPSQDIISPNLSACMSIERFNVSSAFGTH